MEDDIENMMPIINNEKTYNRVISNAQDELQSYRFYLRWMCVDQSDFMSSLISWSVFVTFTFIVPAFSHFYLNCPSCDPKYSRPFHAVVHLSLSSMAALSFLCLSHYVRKYGVRRFLFFDRLVTDCDSVRHHYTTELDRSLNILSYFVLPCFVAECAYKVWWYASGASQIPFLGNVVLSDVVACSLELVSWIYRTLVFFLVCVLFRLICYLQILRLQDFARVFEQESDVSSILTEHLRLRRHLRIISHRYRAFILLALIIITLSQLTFLLVTTKPNADVSIFKAGELALCSLTLLAGLMIILRSATKITHKAQAITSLSAKWHVCATIDSFVTSETELPGMQEISIPSHFTDDDDDDAGSEEDDVDNTKFLPAYAKSSISFQKRHALVNYFERNRAGITLYGFMLDRTWLKLIFGVELSLVLWLLKVTITIS